MHFLPWTRCCVYTLGIEDKKGKGSRRYRNGLKNQPCFLFMLISQSVLCIFIKTSGGKLHFEDMKSPLRWRPGLALPLYPESHNFRWRKIGKLEWISPQLTGHLVHQDAWGNDASVLREELLQFFLSHGFRQAADVQICISDRGGARTRVGNLRRQRIKRVKWSRGGETWHDRRGLVFRLFTSAKEEQVLCIMSGRDESSAIFKQNRVCIKCRPFMQATCYYIPTSMFCHKI